jgi:hypothetical protein
MVLMVLVALSVLSALSLQDALLAARVATLAEDGVRVRAAVIAGVAGLAEPPDLPWLCLQPPSAPALRVEQLADGSRLELRWWMVAPGVLRVEVAGRGPGGAQHRRVGWMRPDSLLPLDPRPGCPDAQRLLPLGDDWLGAHPAG